VSLCYEKLVAEAGGSSESRGRGTVGCWKLLPSNGSEDVTVDTRVCMCARACVCSSEL
jgi:hypothetical protein